MYFGLTGNSSLLNVLPLYCEHCNSLNVGPGGQTYKYNITIPGEPYPVLNQIEVVLINNKYLCLIIHFIEESYCI